MKPYCSCYSLAKSDGGHTQGLKFKDWLVPSHTSVSIPIPSGLGIRVYPVPCSPKGLGLFGKRCWEETRTS